VHPMDMADGWERNAGHDRWAQPGSRAVGCPNTSFAPLGYPRCRRNGGHERGAPFGVALLLPHATTGINFYESGAQVRYNHSLFSRHNAITEGSTSDA
jgi:hypothetical protein